MRTATTTMRAAPGPTGTTLAVGSVKPVTRGEVHDQKSMPRIGATYELVRPATHPWSREPVHVTDLAGRAHSVPWSALGRSVSVAADWAPDNGVELFVGRSPVEQGLARSHLVPSRWSLRRRAIIGTTASSGGASRITTAARRALEAGAHGLIVPMVRSVAGVRHLLDALEDIAEICAVEQVRVLCFAAGALAFVMGKASTCTAAPSSYAKVKDTVAALDSAVAGTACSRPPAPERGFPGHY